MRTASVLAMLIAATLGASSATDQLASLHALVGTWSCSYQAGAMKGTYKAVYTYDMNGNWLVERDTWTGGGDEGRFTYDPKQKKWVAVVTASDRSTTIFEGTGGANHVVYRTVYPNGDAKETIDRVSARKYTVHFSQTTNGKTATSSDVCVKR